MFGVLVCEEAIMDAVNFVCAGLLGAAPAMPLLTNPALSTVLVQLLLQNQVQQVLSHVGPVCPFWFDFLFYLFTSMLLFCLVS